RELDPQRAERHERRRRELEHDSSSGAWTAVPYRSRRRARAGVSRETTRSPGRCAPGTSVDEPSGEDAVDELGLLDQVLLRRTRRGGGGGGPGHETDLAAERGLEVERDVRPRALVLRLVLRPHDLGVTERRERLADRLGVERVELLEPYEGHPVRPALLTRRLELPVQLAGREHDPTHATALRGLGVAEHGLEGARGEVL